MVKRLLTLFFTGIAVLSTGSTAYAQKIDRGINTSLFVPKGQWLTGGTFSYSDYGLKDYEFLFVKDISADGYVLNASPFLGYFVADNLAIGTRFGYKRTLLRFDNTDINLSEDLTFNIADYYNLQHVYYGTVMMRNYTAIAGSKIFGLFNETRLTFGGGQGKILNGVGDNQKGIYQDIFELNVGFAPGMAAFITDEVALEISIGVMGFTYKRINQTTNQVYEGSFTKNSGNFKIDLFSVSIGIAFYIPTLKPSLRSVFGGKGSKKNNPAGLIPE